RPVGDGTGCPVRVRDGVGGGAGRRGRAGPAPRLPAGRRSDGAGVAVEGPRSGNRAAHDRLPEALAERRAARRGAARRPAGADPRPARKPQRRPSRCAAAVLGRLHLPWPALTTRAWVSGALPRALRQESGELIAVAAIFLRVASDPKRG